MTNTASVLNVLALDTSTDQLVCGVARVSTQNPGYDLLATGDHACRRHANVELINTCMSCLDEAGLGMADVDAILVGRGPGSFTGVRIGIATAKGLAVGRDVALYGASTLDAVAWTAWLAGLRGHLGVVGDAMRGEVYPGLYQLTDAGITRQFDIETVAKADAAVELWAALPDAAELILTGDGLKKYAQKFTAAGVGTLTDQALWAPTAEGLFRAACFSSHAGQSAPFATEAGDPALVLPVYTRLSDAEENELRRLGVAERPTLATTGCDEIFAGRHLQLRPMSLNDVDALAALDAISYEGSGHTPWSAALFAEELAPEATGRSWWVAHDEGTLVGVCGGRLAGDAVEILDVAVSPARRREKIAQRLLARVTYDAQMLGATTATLEVFEQNEPAVALYTKLGFEVVAKRPHYYGTNKTALIMEAQLPLALELPASAPEPKANVRPWPILPGLRTDVAQAAIDAKKPLVLAIESSCDETAMSIIGADGAIVANVVATQIDFHARFGGVVPEIASRKHTEAIVGVYEEVMSQAGAALGVDTLMPSDLACVGVTQGPGLVGALVVGVAFAKGLAAGAYLNLVGVNHLEGHLYANLFETPDLQPPFIASLVSGGHTMLVYVKDWGSYQVLGSTIDDAVGEAFDKVAKALGLGYPGGPVISRLAAKGNPRAIQFPRAMLHSHDYRFSLSGLKTAVITYIEHQNAQGIAIHVPDLAASFEAAVIDVQVAKALTACEEFDVQDFCVGGGVAANPALRAALTQQLGAHGIRVTVPPMSACTDNAAMIALVALRDYQAGIGAGFDMDANPNMSL